MFFAELVISDTKNDATTRNFKEFFCKEIFVYYMLQRVKMRFDYADSKEMYKMGGSLATRLEFFKRAKRSIDDVSRNRKFPFPDLLRRSRSLKRRESFLAWTRNNRRRFESQKLVKPQHSTVHHHPDSWNIFFLCPCAFFSFFFFLFFRFPYFSHRRYPSVATGAAVHPLYSLLKNFEVVSEKRETRSRG